jgi:hypothetical protein
MDNCHAKAEARIATKHEKAAVWYMDVQKQSENNYRKVERSFRMVKPKFRSWKDVTTFGDAFWVKVSVYPVGADIQRRKHGYAPPPLA